MSKWLPVINKEGIMFFYDKTNGKSQWTFPKTYDSKRGKEINVFFKDWVKVTYGDKIYWLNTKTSKRQNVKPGSTTYIFEACYLDNLAFVELFFDYNGDINLNDKQDRNCLHYTAMNDNDALTRILIGLGCDVDHKDNMGFTPLVYCIKYRSYKSLKILIDNNADVNVVDLKRNCLLHYAVKTRNYKLVLFLVKNGAKMTIKNKRGEFPIDIAVQENNWPMVDMMTKLGNLDRIQRELEEDDEFVFNEELPYELMHSRKEDKKDRNKGGKYNRNNKGISKKNKSKVNKGRIDKEEYDSDKDDDDYKNGNEEEFPMFSMANKRSNKLTKSNNSNNSLKQRLSIEEINFARENEEIEKQEVKRLKLKKTNLSVIEEEYIKSKQEKINEYKALNSNSNITSSAVSSFFYVIFAYIANTIYPTASDWISYRYTNAKEYLSQFLSASYVYGQEKSVQIYKYLSTILKNAKIYFRTPPDIENQIEYFAYLESEPNNPIIKSRLREKDLDFNHPYHFNRLESLTTNHTMTNNTYSNRRYNTLSYLSRDDLKKSESFTDFGQYNDQNLENSQQQRHQVNYLKLRTKHRYLKHPKVVYSIKKYHFFTQHNTFSMIKYDNIIEKFSYDKQFIKLLKKQPFVIKGIIRYKTLNKSHIDTDCLFNSKTNAYQHESEYAPLYSHDIIKYQITKIFTEHALKVPKNSLEVSLMLNLTNLNNLKDNKLNSNNRYENPPMSNRSCSKTYDNIDKSITNMNHILDNALCLNPKAKASTNSRRNFDDIDLMSLREDDKWDNLDLTRFSQEQRKYRKQWNDNDDNEDDDKEEECQLKEDDKEEHEFENIVNEYSKKIRQMMTEENNIDNEDIENDYGKEYRKTL